jgi:hypothetical protein
MRATKCLEQGTQKRLLKKLFVMQSVMDGEWKSAGAMPGEKFIAQIMTRNAGVGILHYQYLEYASQPLKSRQANSTSGR